MPAEPIVSNDTQQCVSTNAEINATAASEQRSHEKHHDNITAATMETFFSHADAQFAPVACAGDIRTAEFLCSCDKVVEFLSKSACLLSNASRLGFFGAAYTPVKMDVGGNVHKVRSKFITNPTLFATLDQLLQHDVDTHADASTLPYAAEGFLWLKR